MRSYYGKIRSFSFFIINERSLVPCNYYTISLDIANTCQALKNVKFLTTQNVSACSRPLVLETYFIYFITYKLSYGDKLQLHGGNAVVLILWWNFSRYNIHPF